MPESAAVPLPEPTPSALASWPVGLPVLTSSIPLSGGMVCRTSAGQLADGRRVIIKRTPYPAADEVDGLRALAAAGVRTPTILSATDDVLVLEYVEGPPAWAALGRQIARMHTVEGPAFGWHQDNWSGRFRQDNGWLDDWAVFYAERRVRVHLRDPLVPADLAGRLHRACDGPLLDVLPSRPCPVLTHGDLWAGNVVDGRWLIDPEVSFTDRELDLAYMERSDSLPAEFWAAYRSELPLDADYPHRRPALQLHHLLLQVRHFGADRYRAPIASVLDHYGW